MAILDQILTLQAVGYKPDTILSLIVHRLESEQADRDAWADDQERQAKLAASGQQDPFMETVR